MSGAPDHPPAFRAERYELEDNGVWLSAVTAAEAVLLGQATAEIDPWARYGTSAESLAALFAPANDGGIRLAVRIEGESNPIGVMAIRHPWLTGPYMQFLAVLPGAQRKGHGTSLLTWFEGEARRGGSRNLWICAAAFNLDAQRLYARFGFERVANLDDLIQPGIDEVFMRKRLV